MGKKSERIDDLEAELITARRLLSAHRLLLRYIGDALVISLEIGGEADAIRARGDFDTALSKFGGRGSHAPQRTVPPAWNTFDEDVDEEIDRMDAQGLTTPRDRPHVDQSPRNGAVQHELRLGGEDAVAMVKSDRQGQDPIVADIAYELGLNITGSPDPEALRVIYEEIVRIKNMGGDIEADGGRSLINKGDSLADAVNHLRSQSSELRDGTAQVRTVLARLAAVMQVPQWDADGTELLERAQRYENWKHGLKRRIKELCATTGGSAAHIADELEAHLAQLLSPKEMATWVKASDRVSVQRYVEGRSAEVPAYPCSFCSDDVTLLATTVRAYVAQAEQIGVGTHQRARFELVLAALHDMQNSLTATREFVYAMNSVVLPILARQIAAQAVQQPH